MAIKKTKKKRVLLAKRLKKAIVEKDVESAYRSAFLREYPSNISSPHGCDGLLEHKDISTIMEFKFDLDFKDSYQQAIAIIQVLYYLKKIEVSGDPLPKSAIVGDVNECFVFSTSKITDYLKYDIDWKIAPSSAAKKNPALVKEIAKNKDIEPFIYDVDDNFDMLTVIEKMKNISQDKPYAITITGKNIIEIFKRFEKDVVKDKYYTTELVLTEDEDKRISELADLFFACLTAPKEVYLHPNKKNTAIVRSEEVKVNAKNFRIFFSQFRREYTPRELEAITANKDRILEDTHRRRTGAFFTPDIWVEEAHKMIAEQFGENWKEEYVVWDCACGTANLTRGYKFKELYISTLEQSDINTTKDCGYNPEAVAFQYDFLNEVGIDSVPDGLKKAFEDGEKILFLINPPYVTDGKFGKDGGSKAGVAQSSINIEMKKDKMGKSASQLYSQFLYKIIKIKEKYKNFVNIGAFTKPTFLCSNTFEQFRKTLFNNFKYVDGMLFQASNFADVKGLWGISFSLFKSGSDNRKEFVFSLKSISEEQYQIKQIGEKIIYAIDKDNRAADWVRKEIKKKNKIESPQLSTYISVKDKGYGFSITDSLGNVCFHGNNVYKNQTDIFMVSSCASVGPNGGAINILSENYKKVVALFTARKSIKGNWINDKDEYLVPNTDHPDYEQWNNDAIVYSLFNNSSQQSSLRDITYKDKKWDIVNNFFFMSNEEMQDLSNDHNYREMYNDTKAFNEDRYVYNLLQETTLSDDAQKILDMAKELMIKSFEEREDYGDEHPKYHLHCWDAGWAQLKPFFKERYKEDYDAFVVAYKEFENRMRTGVYKFGFLKE